MDGAASDDEEISALGASPARPRAGGSAASSPTLSLPESFSNLGGEPAPLARQLESELAATHERRAAEREAYHARLAAARRDADAARRQADAQAVELARATEALRDRRDAIDDGFRDGLAYAVDAGGDEAATASVRALVDELRARPADELTLRELATVRVVEASERTQAARLESARAALDAAKRRDAAERAHERLRAEHEGLAHGAAQREQLLRDDLARVAAELEHARRREAERAEALEAGRAASVRLARVEADRARYVAENAELAAHQAKAADAVRSAAAAEADCARRVRDAEAACELARQEASHQRDVANAEAKRADAAEYRGLRADEAVEEKRVQVADLQRRLALEGDAFREKLEARTREVAAAADARVEALRRERETFEQREAASLREARADAVEDARREREARIAAEAEVAGARSRAAEAEARRVAETAEAAAERRVLAYELAAAATRLRAAERDRDEARLENAMLREQVATRENAALEEKVAGERRRLETEVDDLAGKVRAYEQLELELDSAVLRAGGAPEPGVADAGLRDAAVAAGLSRPERRVRHAVLLAQRLLKAEAAGEALARANDGLAAQAAAFRARADLAVARLATAEKPTQFLLQALQERDAHAARLRARLHAAEKSAAGAVADAEGLATHNARLEAEVHKLVQHRAELQHLKHHVARLRAQPPPPPRPPLGPRNDPSPLAAAPEPPPKPGSPAPATSVHTTPRRADAQPFHTRA